MKTSEVTSANPSWAWPMSIVLALFAAGLIYILMTGKQVAVLSNPKAAFYILWVTGLLMFFSSGMRDMKGTFVPFPGIFVTLLMGLGILAFLLLFVMILGLKIPWLMDYRNAFTVLSVMITAKWMLTHVGLLLPK